MIKHLTKAPKVSLCRECGGTGSMTINIEAYKPNPTNQ